MAPIRVGFIGLSYNWGWARNAHFPYLDASDDFQITAICNSTLESAYKAIEEYKLPTETKAYDNFEGSSPLLRTNKPFPQPSISFLSYLHIKPNGNKFPRSRSRSKHRPHSSERQSGPTLPRYRARPQSRQVHLSSNSHSSAPPPKRERSSLSPIRTTSSSPS